MDLCAAPGGKTEHMGELMKNEGVIYAFDVDERRIKRMERLLERTGVSIVNDLQGRREESSENTRRGSGR